MRTERLHVQLRASETEVDRAHVPILAQLYAEGCNRVAEERLKLDAVPIGAVMVSVVVEQWVEVPT